MINKNQISLDIKRHNKSKVQLEPIHSSHMGPKLMTIDFLDQQEVASAKSKAYDNMSFTKNLIKKGMIHHQRKRTFHDIVASKGMDLNGGDSLFETHNTQFNS